MASALRAWLGGVVLALILADVTLGREPRVDVLVEGVGESVVLAPPARENEVGGFLVDGAEGTVRWVGGPLRIEPRKLEAPLPGRVVAAVGLSESQVAVVVDKSGQQVLVVLSSLLDGIYETAQTIALPATRGGGDWVLAANDKRLFLAADKRIYRARHTTSGVAEPKPYAELDTPVRSLAIDGKGYLAALTVKDEAAGLFFLQPTKSRAEPIAKFEFELPGIEQITYAYAPGRLERPLYAAASGGLYRIDLKPGADGWPTLSPARVTKTSQPIRGLAGVDIPEGRTRAKSLGVIALIGDRLLHITSDQED